MHKISTGDLPLQKRKITFAIVVAIFFVLAVFFIVYWFMSLGYPSTFSFIIDPNNLTVQAGGLAWTLTIILVLFYWVSGVYLIMEGKVSKVEAQRRFYYSLASMFIFIGFAQGVVVFYSVFKISPPDGPFGFAIALMPGLLPFSRGDLVYAFALATWSSILIIHSIEKYIRNSKKYPLTILVVIASIAGIVSIVASYVQAVVWPTTKPPSWWGDLGTGLVVLTAVGIVLTIIALPVIYFTLARQTTGQLQKNSIIIGVGYIVTFVMVLLHLLRSQFLQSLPLNWMIFIFGNIIGALILMSGYVRSTY